MRILRTTRNAALLLAGMLALAACDINAVPRLDEQVNATWAQVEN